MKTLNKIIFAVLLSVFALNGLHPMGLGQLPFRLPVRLSNALRNAGLNTIEALIDFGNNNDFTSIRGIGPGYAKQIREAIRVFEQRDAAPRAAASDELTLNDRRNRLNRGREMNFPLVPPAQELENLPEQVPNENIPDELEVSLDLPEEVLPEVQDVPNSSFFTRVKEIINGIFTRDNLITVINSSVASINDCAVKTYEYCKHKSTGCVDKLKHLTGEFKSVTGDCVLKFKNITEKFVTTRSGIIVMSFKDGILSITKRDHFGEIVYSIGKIADLSLCLGILSESFLQPDYNPPKPLILFIVYRLIKKDICEPVLRVLSSIFPTNFIINKINELGLLIKSVIRPKQIQPVIVGPFGAL